ncbi:hypothetical protein GCM10011351_02680 [Paraliobacillus quinghaiensis]|uniref:NodB homology domain-containing protein n=1 Tax=Paraliobacillus quinghaiensis TaxID=470815 RepID=A0A917WPY4_9BACI|nr:polysaccharide deacetylase family protein [Paraliobacillus quinghaiensis]GGM20315.1 hypothetical protein GCM10011351_02680 [Paraliobacillus quinghaiensis]
MKQILLIILVSVLFLFVGCSNESEKQEENNNAEQNVPEETEVTEEVTNDETTDQQNEENNEVEEEPIEVDEPEKVEVQYQINPNNWSVEPLSDDVNDQVVLLTIDDAPDGNALEMAKTLKSLDAKAIFFVNAHFLDTDKEKEILKEIHEMGFAIGNHTYSHQNLKQVGEDQQREEIVSLSDLIEEIIGERPQFFRAPHGANTNYATKIAEEQGMVVMNWTYGYDYFKPYMDAEKLATAMITGEGPEVDVPYSLLKPGANLLMHDREWTAEALEEIVTGLREKGYEMVDPDAIKKIKQS